MRPRSRSTRILTGFSTWRLSGTVDDGTTGLGIGLTLHYHGVRRRGDRAWAWLTGRGAPPSPNRRLWTRRTSPTVVLDMLLEAPVDTLEHR